MLVQPSAGRVAGVQTGQQRPAYSKGASNVWYQFGNPRCFPNLRIEPAQIGPSLFH